MPKATKSKGRERYKQLPESVISKDTGVEAMDKLFEVKTRVLEKMHMSSRVPLDSLEKDPFNRELNQQHVDQIANNMKMDGQRTDLYPLIGMVSSDEEWEKVQRDDYTGVKIKVIVSFDCFV